MNAKVIRSILWFCLTLPVLAQQPNSANHSMTINGVDGPPFPILTNVRTSMPATFTFQTGPSQPYAVFQGNLQAGSRFEANGIVDLSMNPFPVVVADGFQNPAFRTDVSGAGGFAVQVPNAGSPPNGVPLGLQLALQSLVGDPVNAPYGVSLTAATRVTVTQGPIINYLTLGDESVTQISIPSMPIPFYGNNYTTLFLNSNGYLCMGASDGGDFTPTAAEFVSGPPRMAPFWCDLDCGPSTVKTTFDPHPGGTGSGVPGFLKIEYTNVVDYGLYIQHTFSMLLRSDGSLEITSAVTNNASSYDQMTGIGPGNGLGAPQTQKNFVGAQPAGSTVGSGILTTGPSYSRVGAVNEAFFEWFGSTASNPYYGNSYDNPFDLFAKTLHFQPSGTGTLPGSTNRYTLY